MMNKIIDNIINILLILLACIVCSGFIVLSITDSRVTKNENINSNTEYNPSNNDINVGNTLSDDIDSKNLVSSTDKHDIYYKDGIYFIVKDKIVRQKQYYSVIDRNIPVIDYLKTLKDFSQKNAVITCKSLDGSITKCDLSMVWDKVSFGELSAYWETEDNRGILVIMHPDNVSIITEYLYYSDLLNDLDMATDDDDETTDTKVVND